MRTQNQMQLPELPSHFTTKTITNIRKKSGDFNNFNTLQSLTGKYRGLQGNPCNENRDPAMRTGVPCNENRFFPVGIGSQGVPCELYRVWVCSVLIKLSKYILS